MTAAADTGPFAPFEWKLAGRYLRARRKEGFISVIAGFSFLGIMLGVATLIIVMAVMNGFRKDLFSKILGLNGHVIVHKIGEPFTDYQDIADRIALVPGIKYALPLVEGQVMVSSAVQATGGLVRGCPKRRSRRCRSSPTTSRTGRWRGSTARPALPSARGSRAACASPSAIRSRSSRRAGRRRRSAPRRARSPTRSRPCSSSACPSTTAP